MDMAVVGKFSAVKISVYLYLWVLQFMGQTYIKKPLVLHRNIKLKPMQNWFFFTVLDTERFFVWGSNCNFAIC